MFIFDVRANFLACPQTKSPHLSLQMTTSKTSVVCHVAELTHDEWCVLTTALNYFNWKQTVNKTFWCGQKVSSSWLIGSGWSDQWDPCHSKSCLVSLSEIPHIKSQSRQQQWDFINPSPLSLEMSITEGNEKLPIHSFSLHVFLIYYGEKFAGVGFQMGCSVWERFIFVISWL